VVSGRPGGRNLEAFSSLLRGRIQAGESDLTSRLKAGFAPDQKRWLSTTPKIGSRFRIFSASDMTKVLDDPSFARLVCSIFFTGWKSCSMARRHAVPGEGWRCSTMPVFLFIKDKLKTIRKQNGVVGFGTQTPPIFVRSQAATP